LNSFTSGLKRPSNFSFCFALHEVWTGGIGELPGAVVAIRNHIPVPGLHHWNDIHVRLPGLNPHGALVDPLHDIAIVASLERAAYLLQHVIGMVAGLKVRDDDDVNVGALLTISRCPRPD
jgi:hypothetical protein